MQFILPIVTTVLPFALIVWALFDLRQKPTILKALLKISLGAVQAVAIVARGTGMTIDIIIGSTCLVIALFGTADLAACRRDIKE